MWSLAFRPPTGRGLNPERTWEPLKDTEQGKHISPRVTMLHTREPQWSPPRPPPTLAFTPGQPSGGLGRAHPAEVSPEAAQ